MRLCYDKYKDLINKITELKKEVESLKPEKEWVVIDHYRVNGHETRVDYFYSEQDADSYISYVNNPGMQKAKISWREENE